MTESEFCEVIITADNADWLAEFTRQLVTDRLAACGQNIAAVRWIYRWEGTVQDETEARVALHTRMSLVPAIVESEHSSSLRRSLCYSPANTARQYCLLEMDSE